MVLFEVCTQVTLVSIQGYLAFTRSCHSTAGCVRMGIASRREREWCYRSMGWLSETMTLTRLLSYPVLPLFWILTTCYIAMSGANHDAKRLYDDLLRKRNYNKLIRPVGNSTATLTVKLGLKLTQLIDVVSPTFFICLFLCINVCFSIE